MEGGGGELTKLDLVQEAEALRRVISAYLNYASGAEEDIIRWDRSYSKLRPDHRALLKHLPLKYAQIRSCVEANMYFIHHMLQAFAPPFEMEHFISLGGPENYRTSANAEHDRVSESEVPESNMCTRGPEDQTDDHAVGSGLGNSPAVLATDITNKPAISHYSQDRMDSKTSNKRMASEISNENGCSSDGDSDDFRMTEVRQRSANMDNYRSTSFDGVSITENDRSELNYSDKSRDTTASENAGVRSTAAFANGTSLSSLPPEFPDAGDSEEMETGYSTVWFHPNFQLPVPPADVDKVRCIIRNIVRDWTEEGISEREESYTPILKELEDWFPVRSGKRPPTCLVPGAGLGRLAFEISRLGFETQGNEFSYYMMICSSFILNGTQEALEWVIYPWIHSNCNSMSDEHQVRAVRFPDLHPGSAEITEGFSMCAGDFVEVYRHPDQREAWDAVVTCFFIDTAHNVVEYLEIIARILRPGGVWVNLGPLLYHFADTHMCSSDDLTSHALILQEMSIELSLDDVKRIAAHYGLVLKKEKVIETTYSSNMKSMMQNRYFAAFWTMVKEKDVVRTNGGSADIRNKSRH